CSSWLVVECCLTFFFVSFLIGNKHFCLIQFVILKKHEINQAILLEKREQQSRESTQTTQSKIKAKIKDKKHN
ncbi:hypothetical protein DOY81_012433, partial [Sarcophaga bullata]